MPLKRDIADCFKHMEQDIEGLDERKISWTGLPNLKNPSDGKKYFKNLSDGRIIVMNA